MNSHNKIELHFPEAIEAARVAMHEATEIVFNKVMHAYKKNPEWMPDDSSGIDDFVLQHLLEVFGAEYSEVLTVALDKLKA